MAQADKTLGSVTFGPFELFLDTQELRKHGLPVKLSGQAIQVLILLIAHPGQLVTREELQQKLWSGDSFGDFEHGLNAAVNKLREKLGDSATTPTYIETLPGRGYRFIAKVESPNELWSQNEGSEIHVEPPEPKAAPYWTGLAGWIRLVIITVFACAVAAISYFAWKGRHQDRKELRAVPLNALPGIEYASSFSPDGQQVAFCWDQNKPSWALFVQIVGASQPLQVTHDPGWGVMRCPAWSPDGKWLASVKGDCQKTRDTGEIVMMPALGGHEVVLGRTLGGSQPGVALSWSPNGKDLTFEDMIADIQQAAIYRLHLDDSKRTELTNPPNSSDGQPRFSPDGKQIAFVRTLSHGVSQLGVLTLATGEVHVVLTEFSRIWGNRLG